ncbi:MAG TPA: hypothetical protein VHX38_38130 [Pseudonocardiaceae bacterium]|jgi:hypothetical protein|nr:hypothetical protein [Pseudonocardiaceae bacterium]
MRASGLMVGLAGVGVVLVGCGGSSQGTAVPATSTAPVTSAPSTTRHGPRAVSGEISAENGSVWMVTNKSGKQYTVNITSKTRFGSKDQPETAAQFPVGSPARVAGSINGTTVTATRITGPTQATPPSGGSTVPAPTTTQATTTA